MKWIFYVIVALYMLFKAVYGENITNLPRDDENEIWSVGEKREVLCIGTQKSQKLRWKNPFGIDVERRGPGNTRVYSQERYIRGSMPILALLFTRVSADDNGVWTCQTGDQTFTTNVCVMDTAVFVSTETEVNIDPGRAITLACEARGKPDPIMMWYRDGRLITDEYVNEESSKYKLMTKYNVHSYESLLTVSSLEPADAGVYVCAAVQDNELCSSNQTLSITLNLNHPPIILPNSKPENVYYYDYDENITLACQTEGYPLPEIIWYEHDLFSDKELDSSSDRMITTEDDRSELVFRLPLGNRTTATFSCTAANKNGEAMKLFKIRPMIAPLTPDKIVLVNETDTQLTMKAYWDAIEDGHDSFPIEDIKVYYMKKPQGKSGNAWRGVDWNKAKIVSLDESELLYEEDDGVQFSLRKLSPDTTYWIRLRVSNQAGDSTLSKRVQFSTFAYGSTTEAPQIVERDESEEDEKSEVVVAVTDAEILPGTTDRRTISDDAEDSPVAGDSNNFYALVFGVGIFVVIGGCTFIMKKM